MFPGRIPFRQALYDLLPPTGSKTILISLPHPKAARRVVTLQFLPRTSNSATTDDPQHTAHLMRRGWIPII